jgi:hypothetical protein
VPIIGGDGAVTNDKLLRETLPVILMDIRVFILLYHTSIIIEINMSIRISNTRVIAHISMTHKSFL